MSSLRSTGAGRRVELRANGRTVVALQAGDRSGVPVLLVPGYTGGKEDFGPILRTLADAGFFLTAIDLPGQYESAPADRDGYRVEALGAVVRELGDELCAGTGGQVHLLGHSFGGLVARAAALAPGVPSSWASLTLMDSGPAAISGPRRTRMELLRPVLRDDGLAGLWAAMQRAAATDPGWVAPPFRVAELLRLRFLAADPLGLELMGDALASEPDRTPQLAALDLPMLVLTGERDDAWPVPVQREMARQLGAEWEVIIGAVHSPAVEQPGPTAAALAQFWQGVA